LPRSTVFAAEITINGADELVLVDRGDEGLPKLYVVERRVEVVEAHHAECPQGIEHLGTDGGLLEQVGQQVGQRVFPPIDLVALEGRGRRGGVGDDPPLDALEMGDLAAGPHAGRLGAGDVFVVALIGGRGAGDPFLRQEAVRAAADVFADLGEGVGFGHALGHDEAALAAEHRAHGGKRFLEAELQAPVVQRHQFLGARDQGAAHRVALGPAQNGGHAIGGADRRTIVPGQAVAQRDGEGEAVRRDLVACRHLRVGTELLVEAVEKVVDHVAVDEGDGGRGPDRVGAGEVGLGHEAQCLHALGGGGAGEGAEQAAAECGRTSDQ